MKTYFNMENPPVNVSRIAIGNGAIGAPLEFEYLPTVGTGLLFCGSPTQFSPPTCEIGYDSRNIPTADRIQYRGV